MSTTKRPARRVASAYQSGVGKITEKDINKVFQKADKIHEKSKKLGKMFEEFKLLWSLLEDYKDGKYKEVPWKLIAAISFSVIYFVNPMDCIPDVIPVLGLTDDISVFSLVIAGFKSDIDAYKVWKNNSGETN